jgi:hypothetical protein
VPCAGLIWDVRSNRRLPRADLTPHSHKKKLTSAAAAVALATAPLAAAEKFEVPADPFGGDMPDDYRNWANVLSQVSERREILEGDADELEGARWPATVPRQGGRAARAPWRAPPPPAGWPASLFSPSPASIAAAHLRPHPRGVPAIKESLCARPALSGARGGAFSSSPRPVSHHHQKKKNTTHTQTQVLLKKEGSEDAAVAALGRVMLSAHGHLAKVANGEDLFPRLHLADPVFAADLDGLPAELEALVTKIAGKAKGKLGLGHKKTVTKFAASKTFANFAPCVLSETPVSF